MATRRETIQRRLALNETLRVACRDGLLRSGDMLPSVRELAQQHSVSMKVVCEAIATLVEEGVVHTVPRVGTFVGRPQAKTSEPYLFVSHVPNISSGYFEHMRIGFEERIAQLGGECLSLGKREALWHLEQGALPPLSGVFETKMTRVGENLARAGVPCVTFYEPEPEQPSVDVVNFDNEEGGAQVARHLLSMGHSRIAFLALHNEQTEEPLNWSKKREMGWRRVMAQNEVLSEDLVFHPDRAVQIVAADHRSAARDMAASIIGRPEITAVVAANVFAAEGFLQSLRESDIAATRWPAIVCFDDASESGASVVSYLRLPWEKIGSESAQMLWERKNGRVSGQSQQRLLPMQLIPRLTSRSDWASTSALALVPLAGMNLNDLKTRSMPV
jgi:DNA-binding LacI/PurR family transcriptional regulator